MIITIDFIADTFDKFNKKFFDNKLPKVSFALSKSKSALGDYCISKQQIRVSTFFDRNIHEHENTILHEMCHHWQWITYKKCDHGITFKNIAYKIREIDPTFIIERSGNAGGVNASFVDNKVDDCLIWTNNNGYINIAKINKDYASKLSRLVYFNTKKSPEIIRVKSCRETALMPKNRVNLRYKTYSIAQFKNAILENVCDSSLATVKNLL